MRRKDYYWNLYNLVDKRQLEDLRTDQVEAIHEALPVSSHPQWLAWREGMAEWRSLSEFADMIADMRQAPSRLANVPPIPTFSADQPAFRTPEGVKPPKLELAEHPENARTKNRYPGRFDVRIKYGDKRVHSATVNISMTGMQLRDDLPGDLPKYFTIELIRDKDRIPLVCSAIFNNDGTISNRIKIEVNDQFEKFRSWVIERVTA
jgi:hypothetical protein